MSDNDVLSQEEIDALVHGVDSGAVDTEDHASVSAEVQPYDLNDQDRVVRGRLPALDMINERFARYFRTGLFNILRRSVRVDAEGMSVIRFSDYLRGLSIPTSLNLLRIKPLRGTALLVVDAKLVFGIVDCFFGGKGRPPARIEGREFALTELRVMHKILGQALVDLEGAWKPIVALELEHLGSEPNPQFANIVGPSEVVVVSSFQVDLDGNAGELQVCMPYSMLEPIREQLGTSIQSDRTDVDERWAWALQEGVKGARVSVSSTLTETVISLRELTKLKPGDVIAADIPETVLLQAEGVPISKGKFGIYNGANAVSVTESLVQEQSTGRSHS